MTLDETGAAVSGTSLSSEGVSGTITGGAFTIDSSGLVSGALTLGADPVTYPVGQLDTYKRTLALVASGPGVDRRALSVAVNSGGTVVIADLEGTWSLAEYQDAPGADGNAPGWTARTLTINADGVVTGGVFTPSDGASGAITGGTLAVDSDGVVTGSITNGPSFSHGRLDPSKVLLSLVATQASGSRAILVGGKSATESTKAALTSPTPGSTLGTAATFTWSAGTGAVEYWLDIGTTVGGIDVYHQSQGLNLTATVATLPLGGGPLYVRLYTRFLTSGWQSTDYTFTATAGGSPRVSSLLPPTLPLAAGATGTFTLTLGADADIDTPVTLTPSDTGILAVPTEGSVVIPAGQRSQTVTVSALATGVATLTASLNGSTVQSHLTVTSAPPAVASLQPTILTLTQGTSGILTVTLASVQPVDTEVLLTADTEGVGLPGDRVTVPANRLSADIPVTGDEEWASPTITVSINGSSAAAVVDVWATILFPTLQALTCPPAVAPGASGQCTLTVSAAQPADLEIPLTGATETVLTLPASVTLPANTQTITFDIRGVGAGSAILTAGPLTGTTKQATIQVELAPATLAGLTPNPLGLGVGAMATATVALMATQPTDTVIPLTVTAPGTVILPASVTVPAGSLSVPLPMTGLATGSGTITLGPLNGSLLQVPYTVDVAPPMVAAVLPADPTVIEWTVVPFRVALAAAQPTPTTVSLTSSNPDNVGVPLSVTIPAGAWEVTVPVFIWGQGTAVVTAGPLNGSSAETTVTVNPYALVTLAITPTAATIAAGQTQQFRAIGSYTDGSIEDDSAFVTWTSSNTDVAGVSDRGLATSAGSGAATITAEDWEGHTASARLTVLPAPPASLTLTPLTPIRAVGETVQFRATGTYPDASSQDLTALVTWTSSDPTVARIISPSGLATAVAPGATTITATYAGGPSASTTLTVAVLPPTIASLLPSRGRAGMSVTLLGTNLGAATAVRFNGTSAAFTVQSLMQVTATVPVGATTGPVLVTTPSGTGASAGSFFVTSPPTITITSPSDGATVTGASLQVAGTVTSDTGEVGVTVNGTPAQVNGSQWVATIALSMGANVLTATATDATGAQATATITVTATEAPATPLLLTPTPSSGIAPLIVRWQTTNLTSRPLVRYELDATGAGTFGTPLTTMEGVQTTYPTPGLFHPILWATDDQGMQYLATTTVNVLPLSATDGLLREKWTGLRAAFAAQAVDAAVSLFVAGRQDRYRDLFTAIQAYLPECAQDMQPLEFVSIINDRARYQLRRTEPYDGRQVTFTYEVRFVQDTTGRWYIEGF